MKKLPLFLLSALAFFWLTAPVHAEANPGKACPVGESRYRPGGDCERTTPAIPENLNQYPLTCQDIPIANLESSGVYPPLPIYRRNLTSDISQAELGGLGPNSTTIGSYSPDSLAQIYAFNGLFDKPVSMKNESREAARTYWRLMSAYEQANAKAAYFDSVKKSDFINNTTIQFFNPDKPASSTNQTSSPTAAAGSPKLGINIGYGHLDQKFCDDAAGRSVTFLVDLNASDLSGFANCYSKASMKIVRIKNFNAATPDSDFSAAGARFSSAFGNDYVLLGNELNALDIEYQCSGDLASCGATYARQFAAFKSTFTGANLSAAPMNTSNSKYDAAKFLDGAKQAYRDSTFLANNAYQLSGGCPYDSIRCSKDSYQWESGYLGLSQPIILTEYGLAPPNDDKDLTKVIAFYKSLPTDVLAITPLVRNVCPKASGEWLHFNHDNKLVDLKGGIVDPATCFASGTSPTNDEITIIDLAGKLPGCLADYPVCSDFADIYLKLSENVRNAYDALLPFNFDNIRGYQVLNNIIYKENLPYVKAINDALNNSKTGLLSLLSPQWMNDLRRGNLKTNADDPSGTKPADESIKLQNSILARARSLNPNDCLVHGNSTYLPSPLTFPTNLDGGPVKLNQDVDIPITGFTKEIDPDTGRIIYHWNGSAEGAPVAVLNNPKLEDLSQSIKGPQSFTAMFLPNAGYIPNRDLAAPVAILGADNSDTKVEGKTYQEDRARIGRTGGESQTQLCELRNKWLIPGGLQKNNINCLDAAQTLTASTQGPGISTTNIPTEANCDKNAPVGNSGSLLPVETLLNVGFPSNADKNNIKNCYNDLVGRSNVAGYDPALVMAIWLEKSAASMYSSYPDVADFGCAVGTSRMDFSAQIACFLNLKVTYFNQPKCMAGNTPTVEDFMLVFSEGFAACKNEDGSLPEPDGKCFDTGDNPVSHYRRFCSNTPFPDRIRNYYQLVTGGKTINFNEPMK